MIYFDNAATSGVKPQSVINSVNYALKYFSANPGRSGYKRSVEAAIRVYKTRKKIAEFFGAEPENVAFTLNCTQSLNFILKGKLQRNDHIIVSDLEHNAVMRPLYALAQRRGVEFSITATEEDDESTLRNFEGLIKGNTKMILCTHASNVTGKILPIEKLGNLCKSRGIEFAVDAAQTAGVIPINMQKMNIDYLAIASHKGLYAPMGTGILISRKALPFTVIEGGTGSNSIDLEQPSEMPERIESGTINLPGIFGIDAAIDFLKKHNSLNFYNNEMKLTQYIHSHLQKIDGIKLYTKPSVNLFAPVLPFNYKDANSEDVSRFLSEKGIATRAGLHCAPSAHKKLGTVSSGCVRVSVGFFNTTAEADYFINSVKKLKNF